MEQADARSGRSGQRRVAMPNRQSDVAERPGAIRRGGASKVTAERPGEHCVAGEPGASGDADDRLVGRDQVRRRALQPQSLRVLLRRFAHDAAESAMEVEARPAGAHRQEIERNVVVQARPDLAQELKDVALGWHRREE